MVEGGGSDGPAKADEAERRAPSVPAAAGAAMEEGPSAPPARVGPFVLGNLVGDGRGVVQHQASGATETPLNGREAIVALVPFAGDPALGNEALAEIARLRALDHPSLSPILDAGAVPGWTYVAQPPLPRPPLAARLTLERSLAPATAERALADLAGGLALAHGHGLAHGDVRPDHVGFAADGRAVLAGWALRPPRRARPPVASQTEVEPTVAPFLAPERAAGPPSPAADQYALAATLVAMLTGAPPALGAPPRFELGLPPRVAEPIARALAAAPSARFPSVAAFADAYAAAVGAAADDLTAGVWEALERRDQAMALALIETALRLRPDHPDAAALLGHVRAQAPIGATVGDPFTQRDLTERGLPEGFELLIPPPLPPRKRGNPWLPLALVAVFGVVVLLVLGLLALAAN